MRSRVAVDIVAFSTAMLISLLNLKRSRAYAGLPSSQKAKMSKLREPGLLIIFKRLVWA